MKKITISFIVTILAAIVISNSIGADIPAIPISQCIFIRSTAVSEPQQMAFLAFKRRISELSGESIIEKLSDNVTAGDRSNFHLIVVGRKSENSLVNTLCGSSITQYLSNETTTYKREQGYIIQGFPDYYTAGKHVIVAGSDGNMGAVFGVSDITRGLFYSNGSSYFYLPAQLSSSITITDDTASSFTYSGSWGQDVQSWYYGGSAHYTSSSASYVQISFTGTNITVMYRRNTNYGIFNWAIDGGSGGSGQFDTYGGAAQLTVTLTTSLSNSAHTLRITHSGLHNPSATSPYYIVIDGIQVTINAANTLFRVEKPAFANRGEYLNIGKSYDLLNLVPHMWSYQQWRDYIDDLVMARMNQIYFYLWYADLYYPGSPLSMDSINLNKHLRIRDMIDYAHKRGMEVIYLLTPTTVPDDIYDANPSLWATNPYAPPYDTFNPTIEAAWPIMRAIYSNELNWFQDVDRIMPAFYDPGGSFDATSLAQQHLPLLRQLVEFYAIASTLNPNVKLDYTIWGHWAYENGTQTPGFYFVTGLMNSCKTAFNNNVSNIRVMNTWEAMPNARTYLQNARSLGYRTLGFAFHTNVETAYPFLYPMLDFMKAWVTDLQPYVDDFFNHRIEATSKYPNTFFIGEWFWNPNYSTQQVVNNYANWAVGTTAAPYLAQAIYTQDSIIYYQNFALEGELIQASNKAFSLLPAHLQNKLEWLQADFDCVGLLAAGARTTDTAFYNKLKSEFNYRMKQSPTFNDYAVKYVIPENRFTYFINLMKAGGIF